MMAVSNSLYSDLESLFSPENVVQIQQELTTVRDYIRWTATLFESLSKTEGIYFGHGTDSSWDEAFALVFALLQLPWDIAHSNPDIMNANLIADEKEQLLKWVRARVVDRLPLPYVTGEAWFCGLPFVVDSRVLIPRSPIAELIEKRFYPWLEEEKSVSRVLDLCTGSGALAVCLGLAFPEAEVDAIDLSPEALEVAQLNVDRHQLQEQVELIQSDVFDGLLEAGVATRQYDLIISNPPYVGVEELETLPEEYRREPRMALHAEENGMAIVTRILGEAKKLLAPDGILVVEVGNSQELVEEQFSELPFHWVEFERGGYGVFILSASDLPT